MDERFRQFPVALRARSAFETLARGVPALLAHPDEDWAARAQPPAPAPVVLWMHGRTVNKELDPGRYLRWVRAGIAACAIDLPGHGERHDEAMQAPARTLEVIERVVQEVDEVLADLAHPRFRGAFDLSRIGIGGMSAGGMATLARLGLPHRFRAASVECAAGDFGLMRGREFFVLPRAETMNPAAHLDSWGAVPLLALHSEADQWVPVQAIRSFIEKAQGRYRALGADPALAQLVTWPTTGAPYEHAGFGKVSNEAKTIQTEFFARWLGAVAPHE